MSYAVEMKGIYKYFGKFCALKNFDLQVKKGTIHALLGENGAGKSTLMKILYGLEKQDKGEIFINGKKENIKKPIDAIKLGIGMVHQHFMLVDNLTIIQNIMLGAEITNKFGIINFETTKKELSDLCKKYGLYVDFDKKIEDISVGMQQRVEILKALYRGAEILILDEPTAVLTPQEISEFIYIIKNLVSNGKSIIIITHKLKEVKQCSDYCTIIRRGENIDSVDIKLVSETELATKIVGREVNLKIEKSTSYSQEIVLSIDNLLVKDDRGINIIKNLNLQVKKGEIFGIAGIDGNGQKELVEAITCLRKVKKGTIKINNKEIQNTTPKNVIENGISTIHEDRHKRSIILDLPVSLNFILEKYKEESFSKNNILNFNKINTYGNKLIQEFDIRPKECLNIPIKNLSGGNQQKLVIAREIYNNPNLLIAVQPTRGLDIAAMKFIHRFLVEQRSKGIAILLISLELDEIMDISDRIGVIYDGAISKVLENNEEIDENLVGLLMSGGK